MGAQMQDAMPPRLLPEPCFRGLTGHEQPGPEELAHVPGGAQHERLTHEREEVAVPARTVRLCLPVLVLQLIAEARGQCQRALSGRTSQPMELHCGGGGQEVSDRMPAQQQVVTGLLHRAGSVEQHLHVQAMEWSIGHDQQLTPAKPGSERCQQPAVEAVGRLQVGSRLPIGHGPVEPVHVLLQAPGRKSEQQRGVRAQHERMEPCVREGELQQCVPGREQGFAYLGEGDGPLTVAQGEVGRMIPLQGGHQFMQVLLHALPVVQGRFVLRLTLQGLQEHGLAPEQGVRHPGEPKAAEGVEPALQQDGPIRLGQLEESLGSHLGVPFRFGSDLQRQVEQTFLRAHQHQARTLIEQGALVACQGLHTGP